MGACFFPRNYSLYLKYGSSGKLGFIRRSITVNTSSFWCNMYSRVSAVSLLDDSDYSTSNCQISSESEVIVVGEHNRGIKTIKLFSDVARVLKSLNWKVANKICSARTVEKYGIDQSLSAIKILVHVYACAEMEREVFHFLREIVCYYQKAELNLFGILHDLLDSSSDVEGLLFVVNVLIKVLASNGMLENAIDILEQAWRIGFQPGIRSCDFLLKCLAQANQRESLVTLFDEMKNYGPFPSVYSYTIMMNFYCDGYGAQGTVYIEEAKNILEEMLTIGINPSVVTYSTYIRGLCRVGHIEHAWEFIQYLKCNDLPINCYCYNTVMHAFVNRGEPDMAMAMALEVFCEMKKCGISADVYSYSILIEGFCRCGNVEKGLSLLEEMEKNNLKPSTVTYSSILKGLVARRDMERSLNLFRKTRSSGYEFDKHAYNILISGFCVQGDMDSAITQGDMDSAITLYEEMISNNISPNTITYKSLIVGFSKIGSFEKALHFFNIMTEKGFLPNPGTCNHVIRGYCNEGQIENAVGIIHEMRDLGISPNMFSYRSVMHRLCKEQKSEKALELIPLMLKCNTFPNVVIYSILIDGFAKQENPTKAFILYENMWKMGIFPDLVVLTILINVLSTAGRVEEAHDLFQEMISKGLDHDEFSYTSMIAAFCRSKDMKAAWRLFEKMENEKMEKGGIEPSVVTYTCLIDGFCKINRIDMANKLVNEMNEKDVRHDIVTYDVRIRWFQKHGYVETAQQLVTEMKNSGIQDTSR